jgi:hypothetical protein
MAVVLVGTGVVHEPLPARLTMRLGFYEPIRKQVNRTFGLNPNESYILSSITAGAISGSIGGRFLLEISLTVLNMSGNHSQFW